MARVAESAERMGDRSAPAADPGRWALPVTLFVAVLVMAWAIVMRGLDVAGGTAPSATSLLPLLFTAAGLCAAGLLRRRSPAGAWLATVVATGIAALEIVGVARTWEADARPADVPGLVIAADAALLVAAGIAATYAWRARVGTATRWSTAWHLLLLGGVVIVLLSMAWAIASAFAVAAGTAPDYAPGDVSPLRASGRTALGFVVLATLGGAWRDLAGPARRAWARAPSPREFPRALGEELLPTAAAMRRRGMEDERARLAADLHARVLPDLRRAAEAAAAAAGTRAAEGRSGAPDPVAAGLRQAVEDVEQLMHARQSIVLEQYGLVAALEWLAERAEQRGPLRVDLELEGAGLDDPASIPGPVARAAFRVALLAIDNVVRHAHATHAGMRLVADAGSVRLVIADDGEGFDGDTARRSGRGLIDMRTAATEAGGIVRVARLDRGTAVEFAWAGAANPAAGSGDPTSSAGHDRA